MQSAIESPRARTGRNIPPEQWPESLDILRYLVSQTTPKSIKEVATHVNAPEISTRNRLARLEAHGAVSAARSISILGPGKQVVCAHFVVTQYGRDCAAARDEATHGASRPCVNSVFALAQALNFRT
jgi:hypothetical protein